MDGGNDSMHIPKTKQDEYNLIPTLSVSAQKNVLTNKMVFPKWEAQTALKQISLDDGRGWSEGIAWEHAVMTRFHQQPDSHAEGRW
jgi:hypothetical protein